MIDNIKKESAGRKQVPGRACKALVDEYFPEFYKTKLSLVTEDFAVSRKSISLEFLAELKEKNFTSFLPGSNGISLAIRYYLANLGPEGAMHVEGIRSKRHCIAGLDDASLNADC